MTRRPLWVDADGVRVAGMTPDVDLSGGPLVIALHGGGYTSAYFDVPGHSLLDEAARLGVRAIALDRPNYGDSDALPNDETTFRRNASVLDTAIAHVWKDYAAHHDGVVLVGHSIGGAICVHLAGRQPAWPLLGIAISGIHDAAPDKVRGAWAAMPEGVPVELTDEQRRMFFYGPDWTIESDIVARATVSAAAIPLAELLEVVGRWTDEAASLAADVRVPVQYIAFEFERLWCIDNASVRAFAGCFTGAPEVRCELMTGIGHDADHHRNGRAFQLRQLSFALDCAHRSSRPVSTRVSP